MSKVAQTKQRKAKRILTEKKTGRYQCPKCQSEEVYKFFHSKKLGRYLCGVCHEEVEGERRRKKVDRLRTNWTPGYKSAVARYPGDKEAYCGTRDEALRKLDKLDRHVIKEGDWGGPLIEKP